MIPEPWLNFFSTCKDTRKLKSSKSTGYIRESSSLRKRDFCSKEPYTPPLLSNILSVLQYFDIFPNPDTSVLILDIFVTPVLGSTYSLLILRKSSGCKSLNCNDFNIFTTLV